MQHVAFVVAHAVGDGLAAGELAFGFDIHVHFFQSGERGVESHADSKRIVHGCAGIACLLAAAHVVIGQPVDESTLRSGFVFERGEILAGHERAFADVGAKHGDGPSGIEDNLGGFGIVVDVGFGRAVDVAAGDGPSHNDDVFHQRHHGRIFGNSEGDVGERADWDQRDLMRIFMHEFDDEIGAETGVGFAFGRGQFDVGQTILPVPHFGGDQLLRQRMLRTPGDPNVTAAGQGNELKSVLQSLPGDDVAGNHRQGLDFEFGRIQRQQDCHGIVGARIGINDHAARGGLRGGGTDEPSQQEQEDTGAEIHGDSFRRRSYRTRVSASIPVIRGVGKEINGLYHRGHRESQGNRRIINVDLLDARYEADAPIQSIGTIGLTAACLQWMRKSDSPWFPPAWREGRGAPVRCACWGRARQCRRPGCRSNSDWQSRTEQK